VAALANNKPSVILLVFKQPGANVIETVNQIKASLPQLSSAIPPGMRLDTIADRTQTIRASVRDVEFTLALSVALVIMVILLFLRKFRAPLIPVVRRPLPLPGAPAVMSLLGFSRDNLSLMALTFSVGFVVDDAIVVGENIYRHIESGSPPTAAALEGSREIRFTVLSISISLVTVFIPLLLMGGTLARVFRQSASVAPAAVAVSVVVVLTLTPMMCARFLVRHGEHHGRFYNAIERGFEALISAYRRALDVALALQPLTLTVFFATL